jgi:uncharacterized phage-associated protein
MKSPITGKEMKLIKESRTIEFRKEKFKVVFHCYKCDDSGELFTTTELDELNITQVYNQYRDMFNIPFPDEIIRIREQYGIPATKMSEILGFGINSYRQYESGEMPSVSNAKLIQMAEDPNKFIDMLELSTCLDEKTKVKIIHKAQSLAEKRKHDPLTHDLKQYLFGNHLADIFSGYRSPNLEKLTEMVVYFSEQIQPVKTKMNKLLFYSDFTMFKQSCFSISGARYKAINLGPVPNNYQSIFEYLANNKIIDIITTEYPNGYIGEQFKANRTFKAELFSEKELEVLNKVVTAFKQTRANEIVEISHLEEAWKKNETTKSVISYEYAFELSYI